MTAACTVTLAALLLAQPAQAAPSGTTAALQVALRAEGIYRGDVDGIAGPSTRRAVRGFQRRKGLAVDGVAGPATRRALGRRGRPVAGARTLKVGQHGWDVAALQFRLAAHGFPSGPVDGGLGTRTESALKRFQTWSGLTADGIAGPGTLRALRARRPRSVLRFVRPVAGPVGDRFGPRGNMLHSGVDFPVAAGTPVTAAGRGCVTSAGWDAGGYGNLVIISHRRGMSTWYAHLAAVAVRSGQCLTAGQAVGTVGATGHASGPHLHFEMRLRGAVLDPFSGMG